MLLPRSAAAVPLVVLASSPSTNDALRALADDAPEFTVVATGDQTAGRGRLGREWVAPAGQTIAASALLRPRLHGGEPLELTHWGWIPLMAGVAVARAVAAVIPSGVAGLKWPNDVQVRGRKVSGILAELLPSGDGLVLGVGINLEIPADALPTPTSTSLALEGAPLSGDALADAVLSGWLTEFRALYEEFLRVGGDAEGSGVRDQVAELCTTLGQRVRVTLPGGGVLTGAAIDLDRAGRLVIRSESDGTEQAVAAGDVTHLRYE